MAFLSQATSSWRLASSSRLPFRSMLLTPRGGPWCLAPRAHQIPVYLMVFSTFLCRAFTAHETEVITGALPQASPAGVMAPSGSLPPLENGDRLTRSDFEQRYDAMPHIKKAELLEGIVY